MNPYQMVLHRPVETAPFFAQYEMGFILLAGILTEAANKVALFGLWASSERHLARKSC
jgi:hypothetical protein